MILWSWLGFLCVLWALKMQQEHERAEAERRRRQRLQRLGLAPIPGADGRPRASAEAE